MNKTAGNAIRLKLTDLQPALKNLQIKARGKVRSSWNQDCGAETHISGSGCKHPKFFAPAPKFFAPAPERLGPFTIKNNCILCYWLATQKYVCWMGTQISGIQNFLAPAPSTALVGSKCFWKWITLFLQMQLPSFCLLIFVLTKLPLYFISIEIISN